MKEFKRAQIWLVDFDPSFGHEYKKIRSATLIQQDKYLTSGNLLTVIPISFQTSKSTQLDILLKKDTQNRLKADSFTQNKTN